MLEASRVTRDQYLEHRFGLDREALEMHRVAPVARVQAEEEHHGHPERARKPQRRLGKARPRAEKPAGGGLFGVEIAVAEQPHDFAALEAFLGAQQRIGTPVCLDESAQSLAHVQAAIRLKSCRVVNIKMARVGGLTESREIQALCAQHDIPCWVGGMLESAIGGAICAELATLSNFTYPGDIFPSSYFYTNDLGKPEIVLSGRGEVATSRVPGIAQAPDPELLKRWTAEHAAFRAPSTR